MPKYLTGQQYKDLDEGVPLPSTAIALAHVIARAEQAVDAHMEFDMRYGGFEMHPVWWQYKWDANTLETPFPNYPVPIQQINRYRIQVSNITTAGAGFFANINSGDVVINQTGGYLEIVPLQAITYSLAPVILQLGLKHPIVQVDGVVGFYLPYIGEQFINTGDNLTYKALRGFWAQAYNQALHIQPNTLPPIPPNIYVNGALQSSGYTLNSTEGSVTFASPQSASSVVSGDYTSTIPDATREATVRQTTFLLGQIAINRLGLQGLDTIKTGDQQITRIKQVRGVTSVDVLCDDAAACLAGYKEIPMA